MKNKSETSPLPILFPINSLIINAAIVSAKIEGIEINEEQLQNTFTCYHRILAEHFSHRTKTAVH